MPGSSLRNSSSAPIWTPSTAAPPPWSTGTPPRWVPCAAAGAWPPLRRPGITPAWLPTSTPIPATSASSLKSQGTPCASSLRIPAKNSWRNSPTRPTYTRIEESRETPFVPQYMLRATRFLIKTSTGVFRCY